jgi:hypothetical protein
VPNTISNMLAVAINVDFEKIIRLAPLPGAERAGSHETPSI